MDLGLDGKVALVTAASKGIGRAVALELAAEGARVAIASRGANSLADGADFIRQAPGRDVATYTVDLLNDRDVAKLADDVERDLGPLDILVNSSAGPRTKLFTELSDADWLEALDTKFLAQVRPSREIFPRMKARSGGRIVNIVGSNGKYPQRYAMTVGVVNAALLNLTKARRTTCWSTPSAPVSPAPTASPISPSLRWMSSASRMTKRWPDWSPAIASSGSANPGKSPL